MSGNPLSYSPAPTNPSMDYHRNPQAPTPGLLIRDAGLLLLRIGVASLLITYHGWDQAIAGWKHLWQQQPWPFLDVITKYGLPIPQVIAVLSVLIIVLCSLGLFFGVVARLSAALLLVLAAGAISLNFWDPIAEKFWIYSVVYVVLLLSGPGCFSLAKLLSRS